MPTTFLNCCEQLIEDAGISGSITSVTNQTGEFKRVVNWIIRATTEIEGTWFDWDFLHTFHTFNTVAATCDYPAPADHNLWDLGTAKVVAEEMSLGYCPWVRLKKDPTAAVAGDPYNFTVLPDGSIRLYDTPISVKEIGINYWKTPTVLVNNTDEPLIPEQFRDIIVAKALQFYANYESADESKQSAMEVFAARLRQLESHSAPSRQARDSINTGADIVVSAGSTDGYYE